MPTFQLQLPVVVGTLENGVRLLWPLAYPEVSAVGHRPSRLIEEVKRTVQRVMDDWPLLEHHRRRLAGEFEVQRIEIPWEPPRGSFGWNRPVTLDFHCFYWRHGTEAQLAYVPALDIAVVARRGEDLERMVPDHIRFALRRQRPPHSLPSLLWLQRFTQLEVETVDFSAEIRTPKQVALAQQQQQEPSVLKEVATNLSHFGSTPVYERDDVIERLVETLAGRKPRSVLLVGPSGVGKYEGNSQGVGQFLRPYLERGDVLAIAECTDEQLALVQRDWPQMVDAWVPVAVEEPSLEQGREILRRYVREQARSGRWPLDEPALETLDRLHRRYATYSAYPGRPLRFLQNLLQDRSDWPLASSDIQQAFSQETGLPRQMLDETIPLDLAEARGWFEGRVIGQPEAVQVVVDLLATVKAGLARPQRPIASLLLLGPTGVGKTEMAKALAEFLYRDPGRMTRIDMSEYADPLAVERLIGGPLRAEGLLTSKVREQPFGVVLLDEFEKAHPRLLDVLLQVLGEGRLTDAAGRLADFRNTVIVMTSNLGSEAWRRAGLGFGQEGDSSERVREHFLREVRQQVRPELFNRLDRLVSFQPLDRVVLRRIAQRELELLRQRDGLRFRPVEVHWPDALSDRLAHLGHDPRYGARPLKRAVARHLLAPLAEALNDYSHETRLQAQIELEPQQIRVQVRGVDGADFGERPRLRSQPSDPACQPVDAGDGVGADLAEACCQLRREAARVQQSHVVLGLQNEMYRLHRLEQRALARNRTANQSAAQLKQLARLRELADRVESLVRTATDLEERVLMACYTGQTLDPVQAQSELAATRLELKQMILDLYARNFRHANFITLAVYGEQPGWVSKLAEAYCQLSQQRGAHVTFYVLQALTDAMRQSLPPDCFPVGAPADADLMKLKRSSDTVLAGRHVSDPASFFTAPEELAIGVAMSLRGSLVRPLWEPEAGLHVWLAEPKPHRCLVHSSEAAITDYRPPPRVDRRSGMGHQPARRIYDPAHGTLDDKRLGGKRHWTAQDLPAALGSAAEQYLLSQARAWLQL